MKVLEALWLGQIEPDRCPIRHTPEYKQKIREQDKRCDEFCSTLTKEQMADVLELEAEHNSIVEMEVGSIYIEAFKLGARMMLEVLSEA